ncbi:MAG: hypothetical protein V4490_03485 [Pseudomonadota bacterium]
MRELTLLEQRSVQGGFNYLELFGGLTLGAIVGGSGGYLVHGGKTSGFVTWALVGAGAAGLGDIVHQILFERVSGEC